MKSGTIFHKNVAFSVVGRISDLNRLLYICFWCGETLHFFLQCGFWIPTLLVPWYTKNASKFLQRNNCHFTYYACKNDAWHFFKYWRENGGITKIFLQCLVKIHDLIIYWFLSAAFFGTQGLWSSFYDMVAYCLKYSEEKKSSYESLFFGVKLTKTRLNTGGLGGCKRGAYDLSFVHYQTGGPGPGMMPIECPIW